MDDSPPLGERLAANLTADQSVSLTAIGLGVAAFVSSAAGSPVSVIADFPAPFLLSLSLMNVAFVYGKFWPETYEPRRAVLWTVVYGIGTVTVFVGVLGLASSGVENRLATAGAFVTTAGAQIGSALLYARSRR